MRLFVLAAAAALILLMALPPASAAPNATLAIEGPDAATARASATLKVTLALSDFACTRDSPFQVTLNARTSGEAQATLSTDQLVYVVPAASYAFAPYEGAATVDITMSGTGAATVTATFESDGGDCIVVGGFPSATATFTIHSVASNPTNDTSAAPPTNTTPAGGTTPPANDTSTPPRSSDTNSTGTGNSTTTTTNGTSPSGARANSTNATGPVDQLPAGKGYVGDYKPPEESSKVPGPSMVLIAAAVGIAAVALRKR